VKTQEKLFRILITHKIRAVADAGVETNTSKVAAMEPDAFHTHILQFDLRKKFLNLRFVL
jgi:hypothetical protein